MPRKGALAKEKVRKAKKDKKEKKDALREERDEIDKLLSFELNEVSQQAEASWYDSERSVPVTPVHDPVIELRRRIEQLLLQNGGEITLGRAEEELQTALNNQVLSSFSITRSSAGTAHAIICLTAKQACHFLEEPSLQMAALQSDYLDLSKEVMELGLDFQNEEKFRRRFDDLLVKREEVKTAAERLGWKPQEWRTLAPMTEDEKKLLHDVRRVMKALSPHETWISLSQLLEDAKIRRARWKLPPGLALWEWLVLRCGDQLRKVNQKSDMLLQLDEGPEKLLSVEERRQELSLAVFETLSLLQRDFPEGDGLALEDLQRLPAIASLHFAPKELLEALKRQKTVEVVERHGQFTVQLSAGTPRDGNKRKIAEIERSEDVQGKKDEAPVTVSDWEKLQEKFFKGWPALPKGWLRVMSRSTGKLFFVNRNTGATQLEEPQEPAPQRS